MGKKGTPHRKWSKEEKLRFIRLHLDEHISITEIERKYGVGQSLVSAWVKRYLEDGEEALEPKNGNPYAALHTSKSLSEVDRLRLIIAKQDEVVRSNRINSSKENPANPLKQTVCGVFVFSERFSSTPEKP